VHKLQKLDLLVLAQLDPLHLHHLALVLLQPHVDYASRCVEVAHYRFYQVEFYGLIFQWPSVVFELLVCSFGKPAHVACRQMFEMYPAADVLFGFILQKLNPVFDPIEYNLLQRVGSVLHEQLSLDEPVQLLT
jgi:hypothetical protein